MPNLPADAYRILSSTLPIDTAFPQRNVPAKHAPEPVEDRRSRKRKPGAVSPKKPKRERKRILTQKQKREKQERQEEEEKERQIRLHIEQEMQRIALEREKARKEREEREFHTHQRRLVLQQRLQEGQHAWRLEWQRQQPYLREQLRAEEARESPVVDAVYGQYLQEFTQLL